MSRETDTPSSGPDGRGGAAYPSGTPPYGTPAASDDRTDAGRSAAQPEERKTETTLTTRIRINIPGSRPIPPVVVRTPVADTESADGSTTAEVQLPSSALPTRPVEPGAELALPTAEEKTSDWFAPRKSGPAKGGQGGGGTNGAGIPGGSAAGSPSAPAAGAPGAAGAGFTGRRSSRWRGRRHERDGRRPPGRRERRYERRCGIGGATGAGPVAPGHGGGTGSFDVTEALGAGSRANGGSHGGGPNGGGPGEPRRDDLPYFSDNGQQAGFPGPNGQGGQGGYPEPNGQGELGGFPGATVPAGAPSSSPARTARAWAPAVRAVPVDPTVSTARTGAAVTAAPRAPQAPPAVRSPATASCCRPAPQAGHRARSAATGTDRVHRAA